MRIYSLGSVNIDYVYGVDHFVRAGETLSSAQMNIYPGGKGLNQSIAAARAGGAVLHGVVLGDNGAFLLETLSASGVDTSRIETVGGSCGHAIIQVDKSGQNSILLFPGTNYSVDKAYAQRFLCDAEAGDFLILQNEISALGEIMELAHEKKMQIALNPSPLGDNISKLPLQYVKWWFCNEIEGAALFGGENVDALTRNFLRQYPDANLILTLGKDGSIFVNRTQRIAQTIYPVQAVDTTAAGDTFAGYFIAAVAEGKEIAFAMDLAARASSITVSRPGASCSIPYRREL